MTPEKSNSRAPIPTEAMLQESVTAMRPLVMEGIRAARKGRHRKWFAGGTAFIVATAGTAITAAALGPLQNPDEATAHVPGGAAFAVDCYADMTTKVAQLYAQKTQPPAQMCAMYAQNLAEQGAVDAKALQQQQDGATCGTILIAGGHTWYWEKNADGKGFSATDGTFARKPTGTCAPPVTIPSVTTPQTQDAVCSVATNWAAVYPRDGQTEAAICARVHQTPWDG